MTQYNELTMLNQSGMATIGYANFVYPPRETVGLSIAELLFGKYSPSSGRTDAEECWDHSSNVTSTSSYRIQKPYSVEEIIPENFFAGEALLLAQKNLGLTKTSLAKICGVSRQTIYDWLNERYESEIINHPRLRLLYQFANHSDVCKQPIYSRLTKIKTSIGLSLVELLSQNNVSLKKVEKALLELVVHSKKRTLRSAKVVRKELGWTEHSEQDCVANMSEVVDEIKASDR